VSAFARFADARKIPAVATQRVLARTTGSLYATGALLILIATLFGSGWEGIDVAAIRVLAVAAIVLGVAVFLVGHRIPRPAYHLLVAGGPIVITAFVHLGQGTVWSLAFVIGYVFTILDASFFFSPPGVLVHLCLVVCCAIVGMVSVHLPVGAIVSMPGTFIVVAVVVTWLAWMADAAEEDSLTRLPNRRAFDRRLEEELGRVGREHGQLALVLLDLDHFKDVNDHSGHLAGDRLLLECAQAWRGSVGESHLLSRYGGDEFALLLPGSSLGRAADLADRLRSVAPDGVTLSAGVAASAPGDSASMFLSRADVALYEAKSAGRDQTVVYGDPARGASELEAAITAGELVLHYQPVVRLRDGAVTGAEALVRWQHPRKGLVPPSDFVPQAERTGAIHALGMWTLDQACEATARLRDDTTVSVNVSVPELRNPGYPELVRHVLDMHGLPPQRLALEITEAVFDNGDPQVVATLNKLRALGARIAIDDFGTGYSSLRWLERFPIDIVKIDASFVRAISAEREREPVLEAVMAIGRSMGMTVVAEGVETRYQADVLRRLGCDLAQGYLFGRPVPRQR
jgi:diguanylate cyclase (GGDEF)-like protein